MTDVKRLLEQATPLPWDGFGCHYELDGEAEDHELALYAVNHLPDYEAAVDVLAMLVGDLEREDISTLDISVWESYGMARYILQRLREKVAA